MPFPIFFLFKLLLQIFKIEDLYIKRMRSHTNLQVLEVRNLYYIDEYKSKIISIRITSNLIQDKNE